MKYVGKTVQTLAKRKYGAGLRDWLQANVKVLDEVDVLVYSPNSIRVLPIARD